jgi:acyl-CoA thioesterase FadM
MELLHLRGARMTLGFTYLDGRAPERVMATGEQQVACMRRRSGDWSPAPFPVPLLLALKRFVEEPALVAALDDALAFQRAAG